MPVRLMMMRRQNNRSSALDTALNMLSYRAHSESELRRKLHHRGYSSEQISDTVNQLTERGYINDAALCGMLFQKYIATGKYGLSYVVRKLKQSGFTDEIIDKAIEGYDTSLELENALAMINKRFSKIQDGDVPKIIRFLVYRGFSASIIAKALTSIK